MATKGKIPMYHTYSEESLKSALKEARESTISILSASKNIVFRVLQYKIESMAVLQKLLGES